MSEAETVWAHVVTEPETEEPALLTDEELAAVNAEMYDLTRNYSLRRMAIRPALPEAAVQESAVAIAERVVSVIEGALEDQAPEWLEAAFHDAIEAERLHAAQPPPASVEAEGLDVVKITRGKETIHVYPHGEKHVLESLDCPCRPYRDIQVPEVIIHRRQARA